MWFNGGHSGLGLSSLATPGSRSSVGAGKATENRVFDFREERVKEYLSSLSSSRSSGEATATPTNDPVVVPTVDLTSPDIEDEILPLATPPTDPPRASCSGLSRAPPRPTTLPLPPRNRAERPPETGRGPVTRSKRKHYLETHHKSKRHRPEPSHHPL